MTTCYFIIEFSQLLPRKIVKISLLLDLIGTKLIYNPIQAHNHGFNEFLIHHSHYTYFSYIFFNQLSQYIVV